jgi:hypothetical protein
MDGAISYIPTQRPTRDEIQDLSLHVEMTSPLEWDPMSSMNSQHHPTITNDLYRKRRKTSSNKENADPNNNSEKNDDTDVHQSIAHALVSLQQSRQPMPASIPHIDKVL